MQVTRREATDQEESCQISMAQRRANLGSPAWPMYPPKTGRESRVSGRSCPACLHLHYLMPVEHDVRKSQPIRQMERPQSDARACLSTGPCRCS